MEKKCCIVYWGLIRGFKYDWVYDSHNKHIYNYLESNNINFDIYIVTNDKDFDDTQVKKLRNLKKLIILNLDDINKLDIFDKLVQSFNFDGHFQYESKLYLAYCYYNRKYIMDCIPNTYDFYISLDIQHLVESFDFLKHLNDNAAILSNFNNQNGVNPRVFIGNYDQTKIYNNIADYTLIRNYHHNPESLLKAYLELNEIPIVETDDILIHRVRACGTILRDN
jgi:predicted nuclease of predicted toxin-antitoxin system